MRRNTDYYYRVTALGPGGSAPALSVTGPVRATSEWYNSTRTSVLVFTLLFTAYLISFRFGLAQIVRLSVECVGC